MITYEIDPSLIKEGLFACTKADGGILVSPLVPEPYRDILAYHERVEYVEIISHNPPVLRTTPDGRVIADSYLFPNVARSAHRQACKEEAALSRCLGLGKQYSQWRVQMLNDGIKRAENEGRLNPELTGMFLEDRSVFNHSLRN